MSLKSAREPGLSTLPLAQFWQWLQQHANCIVRAGTPEALLYDDEDLHWSFLTDKDGTLVAQLVRGKRPVAEIFIVPQDVSYVQVEPGEGDEHVFELISEQKNERIALTHFVLSHGLGDDPQDAPPTDDRGGWRH